ncbi:WLM domain-containing protein [Cladochytrium replicatum]|nr:WLM domain-containing protein [Cladochytrium replicatum]
MDAASRRSLLTLTIVYGSESLRLSEFTPLTPLDELTSALHDTFNISPRSQKLLYKGKRKPASPKSPRDENASSMTLADVGITSDIKITLLGTPDSEVQKLQRQADLAARRQAARRAAAKSNGSLSASGGGIATLTDEDTQYTFLNLRTLPGFADDGKARDLLARLRDDVGVRAVMKKHKWKVGWLTELHPNERTILGFNRNMGQEISLRLRTDDLDGFRHYDAIRKVLLHELTHMVHSEHDENFHALNRQLNKECADLDWTQKGRSLAPTGPIYRGTSSGEDDPLEVDSGGYAGGTFVLGGSTSASEVPVRELVGRAAMLRLSKEEQDMVDGCGSSKDSGSGSGR